jgi:hypothetical protein
MLRIFVSMKPKRKAKEQKAKPKSRRKEHPDRRLAGILFSQANMTQKEIAIDLNINEKTIGKWKDEDNWETVRLVQNNSPLTLVKTFYELSQEITDTIRAEKRVINAKEADALNKLGSAIQKFSNRLDASTLMAALVEFGNFVKPTDLDFVKKMLPYAREFVKRKLQR